MLKTKRSHYNKACSKANSPDRSFPLENSLDDENKNDPNVKTHLPPWLIDYDTKLY